jgi:pimeloyl-ACP methyl ester carboxylesterase
MATEVISVNSSNIEVCINGSGEPVAMIPGLGVDISMFDGLSHDLNAEGYKTLRINPRGVGRSSGKLADLTLHDFAADIAGVIQHYGSSPLTVLGAAFGNRITRCLAQDFPGLVKKLILLSAGGITGPDPEVTPIFQTMLTPQFQDLSEKERLDMMQQAFYSPATGKESVRIPNKIWYEAISFHMKAAKATGIDEWWAGGTAPMLIIQGLDDRIAPPANGRDLSKRFGARVSLIELENAGHALLDECPITIKDEIVAYLR